MLLVFWRYVVVLEIEKETFLLVIVHQIPVPLGTTIDGLILLIYELPKQHRTLIVGDFNLDQMLPQNVAKVDTLIQNFNLSGFTLFKSYLWRSIGSCIGYFRFRTVSSLPSLYNDCFFLFFPNLIIIFM